MPCCQPCCDMQASLWVFPQLLRVPGVCELGLGVCQLPSTITAVLPVQAGWHLHLCCGAGCGHGGCRRQSPGEPAALKDVLAYGACHLSCTSDLPEISSCKLDGCRLKRQHVKHPGCDVTKGSHAGQVHPLCPWCSHQAVQEGHRYAAHKHIPGCRTFARETTQWWPLTTPWSWAGTARLSPYCARLPSTMQRQMTTTAIQCEGYCRSLLFAGSQLISHGRCHAILSYWPAERSCSANDRNRCWGCVQACCHLGTAG